MTLLRRKSVIVTGANGFLGKNLSEKLINENCKLYLFDKSFEKKIERKNCNYIKIDLNDFKKVRSLIKKINPAFIYHTAGHVNLKRDFDNALKCLKDNIGITVNLLESIKDIDLNSFIFTSTSEVYGINRLPFRENYKPNPPSPYSISKVACENFCIMYNKIYKKPICVLRLSYFYGPNQNKDRFIPSVINSCLNRRDIVINDGGQERDLNYVGDIVDGIIQASLSKNTKGEIVNLGHENKVSFLNVAKLIKKIIGNKSCIIDKKTRRPFESVKWCSSNKKAKKLVDWEPKTGLEEGLKKTIEWFENERYR